MALRSEHDTKNILVSNANHNSALILTILI